MLTVQHKRTDPSVPTLGDPDAQRAAKYFRERQTEPPAVLYTYVPLKIATEIVQKRRLKFKSPLLFNDPFDVQWYSMWQTSTHDYSMMVAGRIVDSGVDLSGIPDDQARNDFLTIREDYRQQETEDGRQTVLRKLAHRLHHESSETESAPMLDILKRLRVQCFSVDPQSVLMWSHYGDKHQGAVVAFSTDALESHWRRPVEAVVYQDGLPEILNAQAFCDHLIGLGPLPEWDVERITRARLYTKAIEWKYEGEWRFAHKAPPEESELFDLMPFPAHACVGLIAGCKTDRGQFLEIANALLRMNAAANIYKAERHPTKFALRMHQLNRRS